MLFTPALSGTNFIRSWPVAAPINAYNGTIIIQAGRSYESLAFTFTNGMIFQMVSVDLAESTVGVINPTTISFVGYLHSGGHSLDKLYD